MKAIISTVCLFIGLCLTACGGTGNSPTAVSGVAATGAPIAGIIYLKDAAGRELSTATTNGSYSFNVAALSPPFMLKAEWTLNSTTYTLFSCASGAGTANINPLSNLIVAVASGGNDPSAVYSTPGLFTALSANLAAATGSVRSKLQPLLDKYQADINPISGSFSADHTGLDLLFDNIQVALTGGAGNVNISDRTNGAQILSATTANFSAAPVAQSWSNQDAIIANDPDVAVDSNGRAMVVWSQQISGVYSIIARGPADNTPVTISDGVNNSWAPRIGIDGSGNAIVVWLQSTGTNSTIWAARYVSGSGWEAARQISTGSDTAKWANVPQIGVDASGNAVAVWHAQNPAINTNHFDIYYSRYTKASDSWSGQAIISSGTNTGHNPHIALNAAGDGMAVWTEGQDDGSTSNGPMDVWCLRYSASGEWSGAAAKVNSIPGNVSDVYDQTSVAVDPDGNAVVVWVQGGITGNIYTVGSGWGSSSLIANSPDISGNCYSPDVSMDANGNAIVVWQQQNGFTSFTYANILYEGSWGTSLKISDDTGPVIDTHVRMDAAGNARAVWLQPEGSNSTVRSNAYAAGSGWGSATLVSTLVGIDGYTVYPVPRIGMNSNGDSFTVWGVDSL